ncbi:MAG: CehA/McbA family metallohydrolase [Acidobacteria bacterium]|nr:CehA/McbA family metallohydrolase [Acidobacteriota bacterium]
MAYTGIRAKLRFASIVVLMLLSFSAPSAVSRQANLTAGLAGAITDAKSGRPLTARIQLTREGQFVLPPGFTFYDKERDKHFYVASTFRLPLTPGQYTIRIERGKEYRPLIETFSVSAGHDLQRSFRIERWIDMEARGWYSGDLHVHRPAEVMAETLLAEDLNFAPVISTHYWSKWDSLRKTQRPSASRVQVDGTHVFSTGGYEVERINEGPGAVTLFGAELKLDEEGYELYPPASRLTHKTREQGGYIDGDKPFWLDVPVNIALGEIDFMEVACNHFFPRGVEADVARWASLKPEPEFAGSDKGFALWIMDLYYKFLNCGFQLPASGGSACGVKPLAVGYNRVYVKLDTPFSYDNFLRALKAGRSVSTNGPMLNLKVNGNEIGSRITFKGSAKLQIEATAESAGELESLEILINGEPRAVAGGKGKLTARQTITVNESVWVAARAFEKSEQTVVFGQTSPIYVLQGGQPVRVEASARYWLEKVDLLIERTRNQRGFQSESHRQETLAVFEKARQVYLNILRK